MERETVWICVLVLVGLAARTDWRSRRIPNRLTLSGFVGGIALNTILHGWDGMASALLGAVVILALLSPFVILRGLGAGDWKLMGALGSLLGAKQALWILLATILIAGLMAIVQVTLRKRWRATVGNLSELAKGVFVFGLRPHPVVNLGNPQLLALPFGVATAMATGLCYLLRYAPFTERW